MVSDYPHTSGRRPTRYVGRHGSYYYFPSAWTDASSGVSYQSGYYDEYGNRYENVSFAQEDGSYKNVVCECEYCGTRKVMDVEAGAVLHCDACGGTMKIVSTVDELVRTETLDYPDNGDGVSTAGSAPARKGLTALFILIFVIAIAFIAGIFSFIRSASHGMGVTQQSGYGNQGPIPIYSTAESYDYTVYLTRTGDGVYSIVNQGDAYDKEVVWYDEYQSYYDAETDCYLWYNEELDPPVWQYWYEGISSDYGDYGWMEYDETEKQWYIEQNSGNWIPLPASYDASRLWHIE